jgi:hypothetical protein
VETVRNGRSRSVAAPDDGRSVPTFIVERRYDPRREQDVAGVQHALAEAARRLTTGALDVTYVGSFALPEQRRWLCVFDATNVVLVRRANEIAQVRFERIDEAIVFEPPGHEGERDGGSGSDASRATGGKNDGHAGHDG